MRSVGKLVVAVLIALAVPAAATADVQLWWEMAPGSMGTVMNSGPDQMLLIEKDAAPGTYYFDLRLMGLVTAGTMNGHANDVYGDLADITALTATPSIGWLIPAPNQGINVAPDLLAENIGEAPFPPPFGPDLPLDPNSGVVEYMRLEIEITKPSATGATSWDIHQGVGASLYAPAGTFLTFGPNAPVDAADQSVSHMPVVRIYNIPEPATLALLGFGALALIRRR